MCDLQKERASWIFSCAFKLWFSNFSMTKNGYPRLLLDWDTFSNPVQLVYVFGVEIPTNWTTYVMLDFQVIINNALVISYMFRILKKQYNLVGCGVELLFWIENWTSCCVCNERSCWIASLMFSSVTSASRNQIIASLLQKSCDLCEIYVWAITWDKLRWMCTACQFIDGLHGRCCLHVCGHTKLLELWGRPTLQSEEETKFSLWATNCFAFDNVKREDR